MSRVVWTTTSWTGPTATREPAEEPTTGRYQRATDEGWVVTVDDADSEVRASWPCRAGCADGYTWDADGVAGRCGCWERTRRAHALSVARLPGRYATRTRASLDWTRVPNAAAVRAALAGATDPREPRGCVLEGTPGAGKSHMAAAAMRAAALEWGVRPVRWCSWPDVVEDARAGDAVEVGRGLLRYRLLVLDDYGAEADTDWSQEASGRLVEQLYSAGGIQALIVTTNLSEAERLRRNPRAASRLAELCPVRVVVDATDYRRR